MAERLGYDAASLNVRLFRGELQSTVRPVLVQMGEALEAESTLIDYQVEGDNWSRVSSQEEPGLTLYYDYQPPMIDSALITQDEYFLQAIAV